MLQATLDPLILTPLATRLSTVGDGEAHSAAFKRHAVGAAGGRRIGAAPAGAAGLD